MSFTEHYAWHWTKVPLIIIARVVYASHVHGRLMSEARHCIVEADASRITP